VQKVSSVELGLLNTALTRKRRDRLGVCCNGMHSCGMPAGASDRLGTLSAQGIEEEQLGPLSLASVPLSDKHPVCSQPRGRSVVSRYPERDAEDEWRRRIAGHANLPSAAGQPCQLGGA
jgi:hypothetical protein